MNELHLHAQLTLARRHDRALDTDPVAQVQVVERGVRLRADHGLRHEELDDARAVAQRRERELALPADQHEPAGDAHDVVGLRASLEPVVLVTHLRDGVVAVEANRVRVDARGTHGLHLVEAPAELVGPVAGFGVGHARFLSNTMRSPMRVSHGSWCWIVRENGRMRSARPPVATTVHGPSSSTNLSTIASTCPLKP